jgi:hypothetical protein
MTDRNKVDLTKELETARNKVASVLLDEARIVEMKYTNMERVTEEMMKESRSLNRVSLSEILKEGANIYALWVRAQNKNEWHLRYIGQRKSDGIRERLCQHLFSKHKSTGSKLARVERSLQWRGGVGVTVAYVLPDELRSSIEESLIKQFNPAWNKQGREKSPKKEIKLSDILDENGNIRRVRYPMPRQFKD